MNKDQGSLFSKLFTRKKQGEQPSELENRNRAASLHEEVLRKYLDTTGTFYRSTHPSRLNDKEPWFGSLARLLACCGYETFKPSDDWQMARARAHWKAMVFALPSVQPPPKQPTAANKGLPMDFKSVLRRFQAEMSELEMEYLSKMPDAPTTVEVEDCGSRFRVALGLLKALDNQSICDLSICAGQPSHVDEFHDLHYVLERDVELYPGEFITKKSIENLPFHRCHVNNVGFKIDAALSPALHQKALRPMGVQKVEDNDTWWYNFIVVC